jgi:GDPmannose 4,6-dehydratase
MVMKKRALITGITGQDGSYLAELLLEKDYEVYGLVRRHSHDESKLARIEGIKNDVNLIYGDLTDLLSLQSAVIKAKPHEVYNLAAQSHVGISYQNPIYTYNVVAGGVLNLLEAVRSYSQYVRVYQAGTSEMFGNSIDSDGFQRETTPFKPANPYACAKVFAHNICQNYRNAYSMFISNGILFNHESPRRGSNFVTAKVVRTAVDIKNGKTDELKLGTLTTSRDWGHAEDYVKAMWMILQHDAPDDFVCATGETRTIADLCETVFNNLNMDWKEYVVLDTAFARPEETHHLKGDSSKLRNVIGWQPEHTFDTLIGDMISSYKSQGQKS